MQTENVLLSRKLRKSREVIRKYKEEITMLKKDLANSRAQTQRYSQRSVRLREKLDALVSESSRSETSSVREAETLRKELREARFACATNTGNVFYNLWRNECDKAQRLRDEAQELKHKLGATEEKLEECENELLQVCKIVVYGIKYSYIH